MRSKRLVSGGVALSGPRLRLNVFQIWKLCPVSAEWRVRSSWESRWRGPVSRVFGNIDLGGGVSVCSSDFGWEFIYDTV